MFRQIDLRNEEFHAHCDVLAKRPVGAIGQLVPIAGQLCRQPVRLCGG
jgi:hypothetical protein